MSAPERDLSNTAYLFRGGAPGQIWVLRDGVESILDRGLIEWDPRTNHL